MKKIISMIMISTVLASCTMSTSMNVYVTDYKGRPLKGATVLVDGENIGQSPNASTRVSNLVGDLPMIKVWKDGYIPVQTQAVGETKPASVIGGLLIFIPFLWAYGPKSHQHITLISETD